MAIRKKSQREKIFISKMDFFKRLGIYESF